MRCKILKIEVEKSRLFITEKSKTIHLFDEEKTGLDASFYDPLRKFSGAWQPILPVLVSDEEIHDGDKYVAHGAIHVFAKTTVLESYAEMVSKEGFGCDERYCFKLITDDTTDLYERIAAGELVEGEWYEFAEGSCSLPCGPSDFYKGGKCDLNGCYGNKLSRPLRVVEKTPIDKVVRVPLTNNPLDKITESKTIDPIEEMGGRFYPTPSQSEITEQEIEEKVKDIVRNLDFDFEAHQAAIWASKEMAKWAIERMNNRGEG